MPAPTVRRGTVHWNSPQRSKNVKLHKPPIVSRLLSVKTETAYTFSLLRDWQFLVTCRSPSSDSFTHRVMSRLSKDLKASPTHRRPLSVMALHPLRLSRTRSPRAVRAFRPSSPTLRFQ